jgi:uncharacterized protein
MVNTHHKRLLLSILFFLLIAGLIYLLTRKENGGNKPDDVTAEILTKFPKATGYVNDFELIFLPEERRQLDSIMGAHEQQTTDQIAIITFDSAMKGQHTIEQFTMAIGNAWGVGQKGKNNGVVIGIAPSLLQMTIQNGYGIEKIISNAETKAIIDSSFIPEFKKGNYFEGTKNGLIAMIKLINSKRAGIH